MICRTAERRYSVAATVSAASCCKHPCQGEAAPWMGQETSMTLNMHTHKAPKLQKGNIRSEPRGHTQDDVNVNSRKYCWNFVEIRDDK